MKGLRNYMQMSDSHNIGNFLLTAATNSPNKKAITYNNVTYTWSEVYERTTRLAKKIQDMNVCVGDRVAFTGTNSIEQVELIYACAMIGAIFVPISYRLTKKEIDEMLASCTPAVYLHQDDLRDYGDEAIKDFQTYKYYSITYTGGTSGKPKGVPLSHNRQYINAFTNAHVFDLSSDDISLMSGPIYHLGPQNRIFSSTLMQSHLIIQDKFTPKNFMDVVDAHQITHITLAPTMLQMLIDDPDFEYSKVKSIKSVQITGSIMPDFLQTRLENIFRNVRWYDSYGITETCGVVLAAHQPVPHMALKFVEGELWVKGPNVMDGYWDNDEQTNKVLEDGWYKTGDIVEERDGKYYVTGRKDDVIISGAVNIHPTEIESVIRQHPNVKDVCVIGVADKLWGQVPHAFVVGEETDLDSYCRESMAGYKVPKKFTYIDEMPLLPSNKVDKRSLKLL